MTAPGGDCGKDFTGVDPREFVSFFLAAVRSELERLLAVARQSLPEEVAKGARKERLSPVQASAASPVPGHTFREQDFPVLGPSPSAGQVHQVHMNSTLLP